MQQWTFEYDGDGWFHIRNKQSALYLESNGADAPILQKERAYIAAQRWRLVPADAKYETVAPAAPQGLKATPLTGSILLEWNSVSDENPVTYTVLRSDDKYDGYRIVARGVESLSFLDNSAVAGTKYHYKVMAEDLAVNRSQASSSVEAAVVPGNMTARLPLEENTEDVSVNRNDGVMNADVSFRKDPATGVNAMLIRTPGQFMKLPYALLEGDRFSVSIRAKRSANAGMLLRQVSMRMNR